MWPSIIALIVFIAFFTWYYVYNMQLILALAINLPILYVVIFRSLAEIKKEQKEKYYLFGLFMAAVVSLFSMDSIFDAAKSYNLWFPTLFLLITFLAAQAFYYIEVYVREYRKRKKEKK